MVPVGRVASIVSGSHNSDRTSTTTVSNTVVIASVLHDIHQQFAILQLLLDSELNQNAVLCHSTTAPNEG